jgi:hypothetical protein
MEQIAMRNRFSTPDIAVVLLCAMAAGCTAGAQTPPPTTSSPVTLTISFPSEVTINHMGSDRGEQILAETAQLTLTNNSTAAITLQKANECETHVWTVSDANGNTIDDRAICPMIFVPVNLPLAAHGTFTGTETVSLASAKYLNGGHYTLHYTFWGAKADAPFIVHLAQ